MGNCLLQYFKKRWFLVRVYCLFVLVGHGLANLTFILTLYTFRRAMPGSDPEQTLSVLEVAVYSVIGGLGLGELVLGFLVLVYGISMRMIDHFVGQVLTVGVLTVQLGIYGIGFWDWPNLTSTGLRILMVVGFGSLILVQVGLVRDWVNPASSE